MFWLLTTGAALQANSSYCGFCGANNIVAGGGLHEEPVDHATAAIADLAQTTGRLHHPPKRLFDLLALDQADA